ncbi:MULTISPECIES: aspartate-semialdehyde dehydrogenase [Reichenbachiella]|uniref:Aspartate-semialdehyde dehydrogenase n=1 Tax=Reichenbachiella agariperforans TaxID=156994 RepID=A0A1M6TJ95_REIAG|nr:MULTISPECIES: aspartate-semialdehyde dehydrogenase [Reichenbachiella]RJE71471.1 aspartate-semialdehyde dehydrogenase [Reichenbachiella sp. MSK19-1]SHK57000.1 aspartate-semialdehyde dehydrogenase [Reichenbachiella agariperforans]
MKLAVVGATGLVGTEILEVLKERNFEYDELLLVASARSAGKQIEYQGKTYTVIGLEDAVAAKPDIAIFSAGGGTSLDWAPKFAEVGTIVIDNSSAWRMDPTKKLVVPEINGDAITIDDRIIANPNCSTIQMVLVLGPLHQKYGINRVIVSTYQSVTGSGKGAVDQMMAERAGETPEMVYPHKIDMNVLPHIDVFQDNGYTKEEMKMTNETVKILRDEKVKVSATCVRIPTMGGHSEAVNIEFDNPYDLEEVKSILSKVPGLVIQDDVANNVYPMPLTAHKKDEVFVGRIRKDESKENALNLWIVADNLRKGAATNAVQIAQYVTENNLVL